MVIRCLRYGIKSNERHVEKSTRGKVQRSNLCDNIPEDGHLNNQEEPPPSKGTGLHLNDTFR